jgi:O-antigen/teichoic acid export membrane protein
MVILFFSAYTLQAMVLLVYIFKIDKPSLKINFKKIKEVGHTEILMYGFILSITSITSLSIKYIDVMMLGAYVPLSLVGVYAIAAFIPTVIEAPVNSFERISNAKIANEWHQNNLDEIFKIYQMSCKYLLFIGGYLFIGIVICSPYLIHLLPSEYQDAQNIVSILAMSSLFNMITGLNGSLIFTSQGYKFGTIFLLVLLVLILLLNYFLIPKFGITGAAIANATASLIYNFLKFLFIWLKYGFQPFTKQTIKNIFVIIFLILIFKFVPTFSNAYLGIFILGTVITFLYFSICFYLNLIENEMLNKLKSLFKIN